MCQYLLGYRCVDSFTQSFIDGHVGSSSFLSFVNKADMIAHAWVSVWTWFYFSWINIWERNCWAVWSMYLTLWRKCQTVLRSDHAILHSHLLHVRKCVTSLSALSIVSLVHFGHSNGCVIVSYSRFTIANTFEHFFMYLLAFCIFYFVKCICPDVPPPVFFFSVSLFCLLLSCTVLYIFLNTNGLSGMRLWIFLSRFTFSFYQRCIWKVEVLNFGGV